MGTHEQIGRLFALVRDEIRYDPYTVQLIRKDYVASNVIKRGAAYCVPEAASPRRWSSPPQPGRSESRAVGVLRRAQPPSVRAAGGAHGHGRLRISRLQRTARRRCVAQSDAGLQPRPLRALRPPSSLSSPVRGTRCCIPSPRTAAATMEYTHDHGSYVDLPLNRLLGTLATTYPGLVERGRARAGNITEAGAGRLRITDRVARRRVREPRCLLNSRT